MPRTLLVALGVSLLGCGDNLTADCEPGSLPLPTEGRYIDPYELTLADCVEGGMPDMVGRWFVRDPGQVFAFSYPRVEAACGGGYRLTGRPPDDDDFTDNVIRNTWSDATRLFTRTEQRSTYSDGSTSTYVVAQAMCMVAGDQIASSEVTYFAFDDYEYVDTVAGVGTRFARKDALARGLAHVGELGMRPDGTPIIGINLVLGDGMAYVVGWLGLDVIDVSTPRAPVHRGHLVGSFNDIKLVHAGGKTYAVLAPAGGDRTIIADVSDPSSPVPASVIDAYSHSVFVQQRAGTTELYLADYTNTVPKYDITNPLLPILLGVARVPGPDGEVHDLYVEGDRIFANNTVAGFVAFDTTSSLTNPTLLGRIDTPYSHASWRGTAGGRELVLHGDEGMTATADGGAFLRVLDADPASPTLMTEIGRYQSRPEVGIHNFEMHGTLAYIAYYQDGVRVVDLADPTNPVEVAHYNTWDPETAPGDAFEGALGIRLVDGLLYVADDQRGLIILRPE